MRCTRCGGSGEVIEDDLCTRCDIDLLRWKALLPEEISSLLPKLKKYPIALVELVLDEVVRTNYFYAINRAAVNMELSWIMLNYVDWTNSPYMKAECWGSLFDAVFQEEAQRWKH